MLSPARRVRRDELVTLHLVRVLDVHIQMQGRQIARPDASQLWHDSGSSSQHNSRCCTVGAEVDTSRRNQQCSIRRESAGYFPQLSDERW